MAANHLYKNKENFQMCSILKLACGLDYDGFEANFNSAV